LRSPRITGYGHYLSCVTLTILNKRQQPSNTMTPTPSQTCLDKSCSILQQLHDSGIITAPPTMIPDWSTLRDLESLDSSMILIDRLHFIWKSIEQNKVSLALHHNSRMTACGYTYKGHDFGWNRELGRLSQQDQIWYSTSTIKDFVLDDTIVAGVIAKYKLLRDLTIQVRHTTKTFRHFMSKTFGPMLCWAPSFPIYDTLLPFPLLPPSSYQAQGEHCIECDSTTHDASRCYISNLRNLYRYPPNAGWPGGKIPEPVLRSSIA
jgi:hypothetical protein